MAEPLIAVTGATGYVGGRVAARLAARRRRPAPRRPRRRAGAASRRRRGARGARLRRRRGDARGARGRAHAVPRARRGGRRPRRPARGTASTPPSPRACERIVYLSFLGAAPDATFLLVRDHWATEEQIRATGLRWTLPAHEPLPRLRARAWSAPDGVDRRAGRRRPLRSRGTRRRRRRGERRRPARRRRTTAQAHDVDRRRGADARRDGRGAEPRRSGRPVAYPRRDARGGARLARALRRARLAGRGLDLDLHGDRGRRAGPCHRHGGAPRPATRRQTLADSRQYQSRAHVR